MSQLLSCQFRTSLVKRFNILMVDGKELPIPEKKYTAFKKEMSESRSFR